MAQIDLLRFLSLAAIWGSSYLFMRIAAPTFGPLADEEVLLVPPCDFLIE